MRRTNVFQVRKSGGTHDSPYYAIGVPREVAQILDGRLFRFEMTDDGILYRPISEVESDGELPAWAKP